MSCAFLRRSLLVVGLLLSAPTLAQSPLDGPTGQARASYQCKLMRDEVTVFATHVSRWIILQSWSNGGPLRDDVARAASGDVYEGLMNDWGSEAEIADGSPVNWYWAYAEIEAKGDVERCRAMRAIGFRQVAATFRRHLGKDLVTPLDPDFGGPRPIR